MSERNRIETGEFAPEVADEVILSVLGEGEAPVVTATELADKIDMTRQAVTRRLKRMHSEGLVGRKEVGARAVVWWLTENTTDAEATPHEQAFEEFAERAMDEVGEHIEKLMLYGSTARGEAQGIKSDVDIFLVVDTRDVKRDLYAISHDVMLEHEVVPSLQIQTTDEFEQEKDRPFIKNILQEGRAYA